MRRNIPSITSLLCFEAAVKNANFSTAAASINMSKSAFSRQIKVLEQQLGCQLFLRINQRTHLTAAGNTLSYKLPGLLSKLEDIVIKMGSHDSTKGAINLGTYPTMGSRWLMPKLVKLNEIMPQVTVNTVTFLDNPELEAKKIDLAIVQGEPPWPGFSHDFLFPETLIVIASRKLIKQEVSDAYELLKFQILQHTARPQSESWEIWFECQNEHLSDLPPGSVFDQYEMLIDAVKAGQGVAIVPRFLVEPELNDGSLILAHPFEAIVPYAYYILTPTTKLGPNKITDLRAYLLSNYCEEPIIQ